MKPNNPAATRIVEWGSRRTPLRRLLAPPAWLPLLPLLLLLAAPLRAAETVPDHQFKATCLFNFTRYIEWPVNSFTNARAPFVIAIVGTRAVGEALTHLVAGEKIAGHPVTVRFCQKPDEARGAHLVFVASSEKADFPMILPRLTGPGTLTVGESEGFIELGGVINFIPEGEKVRFQVNPKAGDQAGLKISARLLHFAKTRAEGSDRRTNTLGPQWNLGWTQMGKAKARNGHSSGG